MIVKYWLIRLKFVKIIAKMLDMSIKLHIFAASNQTLFIL